MGPDAFRLIAEYVAAGLDAEFNAAAGTTVIGAARHVDDYYIGVRGEPEALAALSSLRDILQRLQPCTSMMRRQKRWRASNPLTTYGHRCSARKQKIISVWANGIDDLILFYDRSLAQAKELHSDSPVRDLRSELSIRKVSIVLHFGRRLSPIYNVRFFSPSSLHRLRRSTSSCKAHRDRERH